MLFALMQKEVRLYRAVIIAALVITILCEIGVPLIGVYIQTHPSGDRTPEPLSKGMVGDLLLNGAGLAWSLNCAIAAALGGISLTIERREGWADLLAMLPAPRWLILTAKFLVGAAVALFFWCLHGAAVLLGFWLTVHDTTHTQYALVYDREVSGLRMLASITALLSVAAFGIAWAMSMILRSPAIAASVAIGTIIFAFAVERVYSHDNSDDFTTVVVHASFATVAGVVMFIGSSAYYLGRVAP